MPVDVVEDDVRKFALQELIRFLEENGSLTVASDSCVAAALELEVSNRVMASALNTAITKGWVVRCRDREARDHYDNPVTLKLTWLGRQARFE